MTYEQGEQVVRGLKRVAAALERVAYQLEQQSTVALSPSDRATITTETAALRNSAQQLSTSTNKGAP